MITYFIFIGNLAQYLDTKMIWRFDRNVKIHKDSNFIYANKLCFIEWFDQYER